MALLAMHAVPDPQHVTADIAEIREVTPELAIWRIRLCGASISFAPGQYVAIGLPIGERLVERPYSICSAPDEPELEFFIELVEDGLLTPRLFQMHAGEQVYVRRSAKGRFFLEKSTEDHLMVASVTGVAPFVSILRDLARRQDTRRHVLLLHSASSPTELGYAPELAALARSQEWFEYVPTISRPWLAPEWEGERGRAEDVVRKHADRGAFRPGSATVYCCGNPQMIRNVQGVMERAGFALSEIRKENYWVG